MNGKKSSIIKRGIIGTIAAPLLGGYIYLVNANFKSLAAEQELCRSIVSKIYSDSEEGRIATEAACENTCIRQSVDELVNDYGLTEPGEIYRAAKRKCR